MDRIDKQHFKTKKKHTESKSFEFGVLHLIRDKQNAPHRIWIFQVLEKCRGTINAKFKC